MSIFEYPVHSSAEKYRFFGFHGSKCIIPYQTAMVDALTKLFKGVCAHEDYTGRHKAFTVAIPAESREQHVKAMEMLVLDLAECEEAKS